MASNFFSAAFCSLLLLLACSQREQAAGQAVPKIRLLLPRDMYLSAIDASLGRIRSGTKRVWIDGAGAIWLTQAELRSLRARQGNGFRKCPGEPTLWLDAPVQRADDLVDLRVIEATPGTRPLGWMYVFFCTGGACRLKEDYGTNELIVGTCGPGVEFGSSPRPHPLTESPLSPH